MNPNRRARAAAPRMLTAFVLLLSVWACREAPATRYELRGRVVSFNKDQRQVVIAHDTVPGLMEAMTMPFTLREPLQAYDAMRPGAQIQATLVVSGDRSWLENPVITVADPAAPSPSAAPDSPPGASLSEPAVGVEVPDFALVNQDGRKVALRDYRGRALALTFIYTRCPLPDYCPLMSTNFAAVNRALEAEPGLAAGARLLSVTVDPDYDTPKVLRSYGAAHTGNYADEKFGTWQFATGDRAEIRRMANYFGLAYEPDGGEIVHTLRTAVVGPDGALVKVYRGNEWKPEELLADLRALAAARKS